ncbi:MAG TPA: metal-binding protein [Candidatus Caenarcaniphilales bacterium]
MPIGQTHDRITLWSLPVIAGCTFAFSRNSTLTLLICGAFLFSGLMFGPDLDIYSRQFKRWGWLRWIWLPYQKSIRHRSFLSHGPVIGTTLRLAYLGIWLLLGVLGLSFVAQLWDLRWSWQVIIKQIERSLNQYQTEWLMVWLGLELGAMSHSLSDWVGSFYKRQLRRTKNSKSKT